MAQPAVDGLRVSDIGGHPLRDGRWFRSGLVFRISGGMIGAPEIAHLDTLDLQVLIDLRGDDEDRSALEEWCASRAVLYDREPIAVGDPAEFAALLSEDGVTEADGRAFLGTIYRRIIEEFSGQLVGALTAVAADQPVGFGCAAGKDRTGLLSALLQDLLGVDRSAILAGYVSQAPHPDQLREAMVTWSDWVETDFTRPGLGAMLGAVEEVMAGALEYLDERHGGTVRYLEAVGLQPETIERLRDRLVADKPD